jgi:hypothetical protein
MFGWTKIFTLVAVASMVAVVTGGAGATSTPTLAPATASHATAAGKASTAAARRGALLRTANLNTPAGAARYLRAIGVNPDGLVIQRGARNYAGPNCPGAGWACTSTAHPVVQIAAAGGKNTYLCTTGRCAVVQATTAAATRTSRALTAAAATNTAKCNKTSGLTQVCSITQTPGADNVAIVVERAKQASSVTSVTQTVSSDVKAFITQTATGSNSNQACVYQEITETLTPTNGKKLASLTTALEGHQSVVITQDAASGDNTVQGAAAPPATAACVSGPLTQTQTLTSRATGTAAITQTQNVADSGPNVSLDIKQNQTPEFSDASGVNTAVFSQESTLTAIANTPGPSVSQTQSTLNGGLQAKVNQFSSAQSTATATQTETQCEHAALSGANSCTTGTPPSYTLMQVQHGPVKNTGAKKQTPASRSLAFVRKGDCCSTQAGNSTNVFTINQTSTQDNDAGQHPNQTNGVQADCSTSGNCTVTQDTYVDGAHTNNTQGPASTIDTQISCSGDACTSSSGTTGSVSVSPTTITASNVDVGKFGVGGMRGGPGTGSIAVSGITGSVVGAFLYWNGPTNSTDPAANAAVTFNGNAVTGTNIGFASDNNWGFQNTQSYRADVTSLVTANVTYSLANFIKPGVDINGVSLIVFYNDANSGNDRNVVLWNGNDSNAIGPNVDPPTYTNDVWDETLSNVPYPGSGSASLDLVVADGQTLSDDAVKVNGTTISSGSAIFVGNSVPPNTANGLWDVTSFDITSLPSLTSGPNTLHLTTGVVQDYLSLVVAIANMPASAPVIP